jgi:hypothetical protein
MKSFICGWLLGFVSTTFTHPNTDMILDPHDIPSLLRPNLYQSYIHIS